MVQILPGMCCSPLIARGSVGTLRVTLRSEPTNSISKKGHNILAGGVGWQSSRILHPIFGHRQVANVLADSIVRSSCRDPQSKESRVKPIVRAITNTIIDIVPWARLVVLNSQRLIDRQARRAGLLPRYVLVALEQR